MEQAYTDRKYTSAMWANLTDPKAFAKHDSRFQQANETWEPGQARPEWLTDEMASHVIPGSAITRRTEKYGTPEFQKETDAQNAAQVALNKQNFALPKGAMGTGGFAGVTPKPSMGPAAAAPAGSRPVGPPTGRPGMAPGGMGPPGGAPGGMAPPGGIPGAMGPPGGAPGGAAMPIGFAGVKRTGARAGLGTSFGSAR